MPHDTPLIATIAVGLGFGGVWGTILLTAAKVGLFVALMLAAGRKAIPWTLHYAAYTGSRELAKAMCRAQGK